MSTKKTTFRHITGKWLKTKQKTKKLKEARGKNDITFQRSNKGMMETRGDLRSAEKNLLNETAIPSKNTKDKMKF